MFTESGHVTSGSVLKDAPLGKAALSFRFEVKRDSPASVSS
jgi:hypothetical protein